MGYLSPAVIIQIFFVVVLAFLFSLFVEKSLAKLHTQVK